MLVHNACRVDVKYKAGWSDAQRAAADRKVAALNAVRSQVTPVKRSGASAAERYRRVGGRVGTNEDVDHIVDLQLGGPDTVVNMAPLDRSVHRSLGAQIGRALRGLAPGMPIEGFSIR